MGAMTIVNNTAQPVTLVDCDDQTCRTGYNSQSVAAGASTDWQYEMCSGSSVAVTDPSGLLLGCLVMPVGEPADIQKLAVAKATHCSGTTEVHVKVTAPS